MSQSGIKIGYDTSNWAWFKALGPKKIGQSLLLIGSIAACIFCCIGAVHERYLVGESWGEFNSYSTYTNLGALLIAGAVISSVSAVATVFAFVRDDQRVLNDADSGVKTVPECIHQEHLTQQQKSQQRRQKLLALTLVIGLFISCTILAKIAGQEIYADNLGQSWRDIHYTSLGDGCIAGSVFSGLGGILASGWLWYLFSCDNDSELRENPFRFNPKDLEALHNFNPEQLRKIMAKKNLGPWRRAGYFDPAPVGKRLSLIDFTTEMVTKYDSLKRQDEVLGAQYIDIKAPPTPLYHNVNGEDMTTDPNASDRVHNTKIRHQLQENENMRTKYEKDMRKWTSRNEKAKAVWQAKKDAVTTQLQELLTSWEQEYHTYPQVRNLTVTKNSRS